MFIKIIKKSNKGSDKIFISHRLVESYRTEKGSRHRSILNLGTLDLDPKYFKMLADRIEQIAFGVNQVFPTETEVEFLAQHFASLLSDKNISLVDNSYKPENQIESDYAEIDLSSITVSKCRSIGLEYIAYDMIKRLKITEIFKELDFSETEIYYSILSIIGRIVNPTSENATHRWVKKESGLEELLGRNNERISKNRMYNIIDKLIDNKVDIETRLRDNEKSLFELKEKIILYDLTNTYFEGSASSNKKAKYGRSKEKRYDCPIVTLGLVIDELGFPKRSQILDGNVSESRTLLSMVKKLTNQNLDGEKPTVLIDAGIATDENLKMLRQEGYDYVCVARNNPLKTIDTTQVAYSTVKHDSQNLVEVKMFHQANEQVLYCKSLLKSKKEIAMKNMYEHRFEEGMKSIEAAIHKKRGMKDFGKVLERIGRLKEKTAPIARFYEINIEKDEANIVNMINWKRINELEKEESFNGSYMLRSSRMDLSEQEMWDLYTVLTKVENTFRTLKTDLNMRPIYHQKTKRSDGHIFITLLAYHVVISILNILKKSGINYSWTTIRTIMKTMSRVTTSMKARTGEQIVLRTTSVPEKEQAKLLIALGLKYEPIGRKKSIIKG